MANRKIRIYEEDPFSGLVGKLSYKEVELKNKDLNELDDLILKWEKESLDTVGYSYVENLARRTALRNCAQDLRAVLAKMSEKKE